MGHVPQTYVSGVKVQLFPEHSTSFPGILSQIHRLPRSSTNLQAHVFLSASSQQMQASTTVPESKHGHKSGAASDRRAEDNSESDQGFGSGFFRNPSMDRYSHCTQTVLGFSSAALDSRTLGARLQRGSGQLVAEPLLPVMTRFIISTFPSCHQQ